MKEDGSDRRHFPDPRGAPDPPRLLMGSGSDPGSLFADVRRLAEGVLNYRGNFQAGTLTGDGI